MAQKILIVEDDSFLAGIYHDKFTQSGYMVVSAENGEDGLLLAQRELPDIILLDILLPKMDGFDVLKALKSDFKTRQIPVVVLSNLGQKEDIDKGMALGAKGYLIKAHFMPKETVEKIKAILVEATS